MMGAVALAAGCGSEVSTDDDDSTEDAITSIPETRVRQQSDTGNCWLYATAGWAESLEFSMLIERGEARADDTINGPRHLSPAYWDYWDWYGKITSGSLKKSRKSDLLKDALDSGGSWGVAAEIIAKRGLMRKRAFVSAGQNEAELTLAALQAMVESLTSGALKSTSARANPAVVRRELDKAFKLDAATIAELTTAFGDGSKTFERGDARGTDNVLSPKTYQVRLPHPDGHFETRPILDAIGTRAPGSDDPDQRAGAWAWKVTKFEAASPTANRAYFKRVQRALHAGVPLPISWYVASNGDPDDNGSYLSVPREAADAAESGGHETLLDDYEADAVPGIGRLAAGTPATPEQKKAALSDDTKIVFLRVKNSWGGRAHVDAPAGYNDLYLDYLTGSVKVCPANKPDSPDCTTEVPLEDITLPAGF